MGEVLLVMGYCVGCVWRSCYEWCGCVNGASPVEFVLSLFYLCAFQMNPVCGYSQSCDRERQPALPKTELGPSLEVGIV